MRRKICLRMHILLLVAVAALLVLQMATHLSAEERPSFEVWLEALRKEAISTGISQETLEIALKDLAPIPRVVELDRNQPESTLALEDYLNLLVNERRVAKGRRNLGKHRTLLDKVSQRYGVQPRFLVALWGIETDFGRLMGRFPVIGATATLAFDGRRGAFFRKELLHALRILEQGHISADKMVGSWAGAMGQFHFIPSSFHSYAVDYDGDGRKNIWSDLGDAFASAANYLSGSGWVRDTIWGREVSLPMDFDRALVGLEIRKPPSEWQTLGVPYEGGQNSSDSPDSLASVVEPDGPKGRAFLVYDNYRALLKWNRSHLFAIAAGTLADRIGQR